MDQGVSSFIYISTSVLTWTTFRLRVFYSFLAVALCMSVICFCTSVNGRDPTDVSIAQPANHGSQILHLELCYYVPLLSPAVFGPKS